MKRLTLFALVVLAACSCTNKRMSIAGGWSVTLGDDTAAVYDVTLPGTLEEAGIGDRYVPDNVYSHLSRTHAYVGKATYSKEVNIPASWKDKDVVLELERIIWKSDVKVDGCPAIPISDHSLTTPHKWGLGSSLTPGGHIISIEVDNTQQFDTSVQGLAHSYTNHTQTVWNGILGEISLSVRESSDFDITSVGYADGTISIGCSFTGSNIPDDAVLEYRLARKGEAIILGEQRVHGPEVMASFQPEEISLWDEFSPTLYKLSVTLKSDSRKVVKEIETGFRDIRSEDGRIYINGRAVFLRGTLECCIFPLKGYPPTDVESWRKIIQTAKAWGLNHFRFHSWCPPEAAFAAADEEGFYLQAELPVWSLTLGSDAATTDFLNYEALNIIHNYGHHPSFCFLSMGNELQGDMSVPYSVMQNLKSVDMGRLYTTTSFTFEPGFGSRPAPGDDYLITQWTDDGWIRGQGVFNDYPPTFDKNYSSALQHVGIPVISHEIGQYAVYPDLTEIEKYESGVLDPVNFKAVRDDLESKGLLDKAPDYVRASGRLAALLYKEEVERAMKTPELSGFQLLDLHDFPGQGTALVGLLNSMWESKGFIEAPEFRECCNSVVPLARFGNATYKSGESFSAALDIANYSAGEMADADIRWTVSDGDCVIAEGGEVMDLEYGYNQGIMSVEFEMPSVDCPRQLVISVCIFGTEYHNHWNLWLYPSEQRVSEEGIIYTRDFNTAITSLREGAKVLYNPSWRNIQGLEGKFVPVFWSPVHFPKQAGSMGLLMDPAHPALSLFPTSYHTDWQWWDLCRNSTTMIMKPGLGGSPIIEVVDNFVNNRELAMVYECSLEGGKMIVVSCDLSENLEERPAAAALRNSLVSYMNSDAFDPAPSDDVEFFRQLTENYTINTKTNALSVY